MTEREQQTLAEQVLDQTFELILSGELEAGGPVNELTLAKRFGVSRGPVREAVQRLQGLGLVTREPFLKARVVSLSGADLVDLFQLREAIEGMACRLAAKNMADADIDDLLETLDRARSRPDDERAETASGPGSDIHARIARGCGNRRIERVLTEDLYHFLRLYRGRSRYTPGRASDAAEEHWQIARALKARDGDLAESLMRAHISTATKAVLGTLAGEQGDDD